MRTGILRKFAACFTDYRDEKLIEGTVEPLIARWVYGLALGYEDLNDHDQSRYDPLGYQRRDLRDRGKALASKSTLNCLESTPANTTCDSRYKKIVADEERKFASFSAKMRESSCPPVIRNFHSPQSERPKPSEFHGRLKSVFDVELQELARVMASKADHELFGPTEVELRDPN